MKSPLVSCIVPVFNGERYLREALDSILTQTYRPMEIIVADDGSTDGTAALVADYSDQLRYLFQPNAGTAAACNLGLQSAQGDFVAFLAADDLWHRDKLMRQMERFEARPELGVCVSHVQNFWIPELKEEAERFRNHRISLPLPGYVPQALLARRAVFETVGNFNGALRHADATDWFLRAADHGAIIELLPEVLVYRRLHQSNLSRQMASTSRGEYLQLVKATLDRRRRETNTNLTDVLRCMENSLISCIVPVFNGERYLGQALDSILAQTYRPIEVIVIDDGSTDGTRRLVTSYRDQVRYVWQPNSGPPRARNFGLSVAKGEFIAFLDADDLWQPDKLSLQMTRFRERPELDLCVTHCQVFWIPELHEEEARFRSHRLAQPLPGYVTQTLLARRALFDTVGDFDTSRRVGDPADWFLRAAEQGAVMELLRDVLVYRRFHENNFSVESDTRRMKPSMQDAILQVVKASLDRRRGQSNTGPMPLSFPPADRDKKT